MKKSTLSAGMAVLLIPAVILNMVLLVNSETTADTIKGIFFFSFTLLGLICWVSLAIIFSEDE